MPPSSRCRAQRTPETAGQNCGAGHKPSNPRPWCCRRREAGWSRQSTLPSVARAPAQPFRPGGIRWLIPDSASPFAVIPSDNLLRRLPVPQIPPCLLRALCAPLSRLEFGCGPVSLFVAPAAPAPCGPRHDGSNGSTKRDPYLGRDQVKHSACPAPCSQRRAPPVRP